MIDFSWLSCLHKIWPRGHCHDVVRGLVQDSERPLARDVQIRKLQALNLTPRLGGAGRIGQLPNYGPQGRTEKPVPRSLTFTRGKTTGRIEDTLESIRRRYRIYAAESMPTAV